MDACEETLTALLDERDGRVGAGHGQRLAEHVRTCPTCARVVDEWKTAIPKLRDLTTASLPDTALRRMENEVLASLAKPVPRSRVQRLWIPVAVAAGVALAIGVPLALRSPTAVRFARLQSHWGTVLSGGHPLRDGEALRPGDILFVPADAEASLAVGRGVDSRVLGPARVSLEGDPVHPRLRLDAGRVFVRVEKRWPEETLRVQTLHGHVEVRGTCFVVGYEGDRSFVRVDEGEVAAFRVAGTEAFPVRAGETFWLAPSPASSLAPSAPPAPSVDPPDLAVPPSPVEGDACDGRIVIARKAMRADKPQKALAVIEGALAAGDARVPTRCQDELGYLRAEALRQAGENVRAIAAFKSLDRPNATKAMRQNALYAAGQLEARRGNQAQAGHLFERAFSAYPDGALAEESLAGLLEAQDRSGGTAQATARRYLDRFPSGMAAARARSILSSPLPPSR